MNVSLTDDAGRQEQHSLRRSVILHLLPGALIVTWFIVAAPQVVKLGSPPGLALLIGFLVVGIPLELGYLLYQGKKRNGTVSLRGIVVYREPMPIWQYLALFFLLLILAFGVLFTIAPWLTSWRLACSRGYPVTFSQTPNTSILSLFGQPCCSCWSLAWLSMASSTPLSRNCIFAVTSCPESLTWDGWHLLSVRHYSRWRISGSRTTIRSSFLSSCRSCTSSIGSEISTSPSLRIAPETPSAHSCLLSRFWDLPDAPQRGRPLRWMPGSSSLTKRCMPSATVRPEVHLQV